MSMAVVYIVSLSRPLMRRHPTVGTSLTRNPLIELKKREEMMATIKAPTCDMKVDCTQPIAYIDDHGFLYCVDHGHARQYDVRCRKLRPHELSRLKRGESVERY